MAKHLTDSEIAEAKKVFKLTLRPVQVEFLIALIDSAVETGIKAQKATRQKSKKE